MALKLIKINNFNRIEIEIKIKFYLNEQTNNETIWISLIKFDE